MDNHANESDIAQQKQQLVHDVVVALSNTAYLNFTRRTEKLLAHPGKNPNAAETVDSIRKQEINNATAFAQELAEQVFRPFSNQ